MAKDENCIDDTLIDYDATNYFSKIALDYVRGAAALRPFYAHYPKEAGLQAAATARGGFPEANRKVLVENLRSHYKEGGPLKLYDKVLANIDALQSPDTFTVTTAHQPNIFGGPLYLVYKILHVIQLAEYLNESDKASKRRYVPFYYMGSEDADLEEIGQMCVDGKNYVWQTEQTGPVGRMKVDKQLLALISELEGQIGVAAHGMEFTRILRECYQEGISIQEAFFAFIHQLFGRFGLLILMPDDGKLKKIFEPVVLKELEEGFSHKEVEKSAAALETAGYKVQTHGRAINLFYQQGNLRERIIKEGDLYRIGRRDEMKTKADILREVQEQPALFSGNVVLRGPFQETVLPDVAFVGGGGELAYWLEMKGVYDAVNIPYPVLLLRNSFLLVRPEQAAVMEKLGLMHKDLFGEYHRIQDLLIDRQGDSVDLSAQLDELRDLYQRLRAKAAAVDITLAGHTEAIEQAARHKVARLEDKMRSAQRKKLDIKNDQLRKLMDELFPQGSLQERTENIAGFYAAYGSGIIDLIKEASLTTEQRFQVLYLPRLA